METKAIVRGVRLSADKGRLVADLVRRRGATPDALAEAWRAQHSYDPRRKLKEQA